MNKKGSVIVSFAIAFILVAIAEAICEMGNTTLIQFFRSLFGG